MAKNLKGASARQKRRYGLKLPTAPDHEMWRFEIDAQYRADLAKDPEAALFLSIFNEEERGVYRPGELHLRSREAFREVDRERKARERAQDVTSFKGYRGPSLDSGYVVVAESPEDAWIEKTDRERALALRSVEEES